jgi:dUTP pyrophosphatase
MTYFLLILASKSSIALESNVHVQAGVVDSDYRGVVKVLLYNASSRHVGFMAGVSVCQLIMERIQLPDLERVDNFNVSII